MALLKNFATVGLATIASRVLGFVRDTMMAAALGTGPVADAFVVAFRLPNLFRRLFAEGAFNAAFVPLYSRTLADDGEAAAGRFVRDVGSVMLVLVTVTCSLAMLAAPWLVNILAYGFGEGTAKFDLAVALTRICFPYLACMSLTGMLGGIMSAHRRFLIPALAPVVLNIVLIIFLVGISWSGLIRSPAAGFALAWGVAIAGLAQLLLVAWGVWRAGYGFWPTVPRLTAPVRRLSVLAMPGLLAGGITQINIVVGTAIASVQAGAVAYLYYAERIYQLPLGVVGIAIGTVLLPEISHHIRTDRADRAIDTQNRSLEFAMLLTVPATFGLLVAAHPIVTVLFERGAFGPRDTDLTADALAAFACGLPAFVMVKVCSPAFFARLDMRTPMWIGIAAVILNVAVAVLMFPMLGHVAVAVATSLAGWLNAGLLWVFLVWRGHWRTDGALERRLPRIALASLVMGFVVWALCRGFGDWLGAENPLLVKGLTLTFVVGSGLVVFVAVALRIGGLDWPAIRAAISNKDAKPRDMPGNSGLD